jgi:hypothetical protein
MNIEQAKELRQTILWEEVCKELDMYIHGEMEKLKSCSTEELKAVQRTIRTLEMVKRLPENVIDRDAA